MVTTIYGIAYECPFRKREKDCPFSEVDHLSFPEKYEWIKGLSEAKKNAIIEHHKHCFKRRENKFKS